MGASILATIGRKKQTAHDKYLSALRGGKPVEAIAEAAAAAGIDPAQIQDDADTLERAAALAAEANKLPTLRKAQADAQRALDAAVKRLDEATAKLQPAIDAAGWDLTAAQQAERAAQEAAVDLAGLANGRPDLLDATAMPAAVRELNEGQRLHHATGLARKALERATEARDRQRAYVDGLRSPGYVYDLGGVVDREQKRAELPAKTVAAEAELAEREAAVTAAEVAVAKAQAAAGAAVAKAQTL